MSLILKKMRTMNPICLAFLKNFRLVNNTNNTPLLGVGYCHGGYRFKLSQILTFEGYPPRTRGKNSCEGLYGPSFRIMPAYAGKGLM